MLVLMCYISTHTYSHQRAVASLFAAVFAVYCGALADGAALPFPPPGSWRGLELWLLLLSADSFYFI